VLLKWIRSIIGYIHKMMDNWRRENKDRKLMSRDSLQVVLRA
jgi:hypothetical protein